MLVQRPVYTGCATQPPRTMGCFAGCPGGFAIQVEATEFAVAAFAPLFQLIATWFATYSTVHFPERITGISHVVAAFPTVQVDVQLSDHAGHAPAPGTDTYAVIRVFVRSFPIDSFALSIRGQSAQAR